MTEPMVPEPMPSPLGLVGPDGPPGTVDRVAPAAPGAPGVPAADGESAAAGADPTPPVRRWAWWTAVFVAVVLLVGAVAWATSARSARDDAAADRDTARAAVARARHARSEQVASREEARAAARDVRLRLAGPLASVEALVQLTEQGLQADRDAQAIGVDTVSPTDAAIDAYNEAVARANVVRDQFNGALERLAEQLRPLDVELSVV